MVTHHHGNLLAKVGLIFHLKELKDVSADTHGHFKYVPRLTLVIVFIWHTFCC